MLKKFLGKAVAETRGRCQRETTMTPSQLQTQLANATDPFRTFFEDWLPTTNRITAPAFAPSMNVIESNDGYKVMLDLPGVAKDEVNVAFAEGVLTVSGERKREESTKDGRWHVIERSHGSFARSLRFPSDVDTSKVGAEMKDGVLTVTLPKSAQSKSRKIAIN